MGLLGTEGEDVRLEQDILGSIINLSEGLVSPKALVVVRIFTGDFLSLMVV